MENNFCPHCFKNLNGSKCLDNDGQDPGPGVIVVCMHCAHILKYTEEMTLEQMEDSELDLLEPETVHQLYLITTAIDNSLK